MRKWGRRVRWPLWRCRGLHTLPVNVPKAPYDVLFCGTDHFARKVLENFLKQPNLYRSLEVLTPPDAPQSWGGKRMRVSPVKQLAKEASISHAQVPKEGMQAYTLPGTIQNSTAPLLLTVSFGHMIPPSILQKFPTPSQALNVHPSLLPQLRGAAPIQWALAKQLPHTGVSIQQLAMHHFDTGRILAQTAIPIEKQTTYAMLSAQLAQIGADLLVDVVTDLPELHRTAWDQDPAQVSYAPKLRPSHAEARWEKWDANQIEARMQAFCEQLRMTTTLVPASGNFPKARLYLLEGTALDANLAGQDRQTVAVLADQPPGTAIYSERFQGIACLFAKKATDSGKTCAKRQ
ncbi:methionyl-tRNA formyltransferase [Malassezia yamatoensis]|uniref:methionyl-tRNA formyltransferase n=1 Tax=Malassezia yamatoensis TaxID=253288 RepID=A0AAJ5YT05_9BASI|nr:methionyl-tRNA formyltransferase [Malassezia yamatoensis]